MIVCGLRKQKNNGIGNFSTDVYVSASDTHVALTDPAYPNTGLKLTIEQWNRVVEFVDTQTLGASDIQSLVDWNEIDESYKYAAVDESGEVYVFENEPSLEDDTWHAKGDCFQIMPKNGFILIGANP